LRDDYGQPFTVYARGDVVQNSAVVSVEGNYDLNERWTLGAVTSRHRKWSLDQDNRANDAYLAI
jgi:hypothetical protein